MSSVLESDVCYRVYGWRHLMKTTEVTAAESNGSLPPGGCLKVTHCGLTACTLGPALGPTLDNEYGRTLFHLLVRHSISVLHRIVIFCLHHIVSTISLKSRFMPVL